MNSISYEDWKARLINIMREHHKAALDSYLEAVRLDAFKGDYLEGFTPEETWQCEVEEC